jgi:hypothetical protein
MKGNLRLLRALVVVLVDVTLNVVFPASSFADGYPPGQSPAYMTGMTSQGAAGYPSPRSRSISSDGRHPFRIGCALASVRCSWRSQWPAQSQLDLADASGNPVLQPARSAPPVGQSMVVMRNIAFSPATTIHVGQTATWRNDDSIHTDDERIVSGNVLADARWDRARLQGPVVSHRFNTAAPFATAAESRRDDGAAPSCRYTASSQICEKVRWYMTLPESKVVICRTTSI